MEWLQSIDFAVLNWLQATLKCGFFDFIMPKITALGNFGTIWIVFGVVLTCTKRYRRCGVLVLISLLMCTIIGNAFLKPLVARQRPCWINGSFPLLIKSPQDYSFPSGHTLASVATAAMLIFTKCKWGILAIPIAVLISFSRLYLYVHFPTDVFASVIIGIGIAYCTYIFGGKIYDKMSADLHIEFL